MLCDEGLFEDQVAELPGAAVVRWGSGESIADFARDVLDQAPPGPFAMAGLSMGGYVAFEVMRQAPERVAKLALLDTRADADDEAVASSRQSAIEHASRPGFGKAAARLMRMLVHPDHLRERQVMDRITGMVERNGVEAFVRQQRAMASRPDSRGLLARIACPTLVLCGREDRPSPVAVHEEMAATIPESHLVVIEHCGHLSPIEKPAEVTAALRAWLQVDSLP
jgi:pimeloyl-ACP methyl ester carboxylesterase